MDQPPFVITIVGAESSGKSTLARQLADYYSCPWVPEYARVYLESLDRPYLLEDLYAIAAEERERILNAVNNMASLGSRKSEIENRKSIGGRLQFSESSSNSVEVDDLYARLEVNDQIPELIIDGGMMTMRMWAQIKYREKIPIVEEALMNDVTSLYLLCRPLKVWEPDPMREAPNVLDRAWIYNQYLKELVEGGFPFQFVP